MKRGNHRQKGAMLGNAASGPGPGPGPDTRINMRYTAATILTEPLTEIGTYKCKKEPEKSYWGKQRVRFFVFAKMNGRADMYTLAYYEDEGRHVLKGVLSFNINMIDTSSENTIVINGSKHGETEVEIGEGVHRDPMKLTPAPDDSDDFNKLRGELIRLRKILVSASTYSVRGAHGDYTYDIIQPENKTVLFVFSDNTYRRGKGGSAMIRDYGNAVGIVTGIHPQNREGTHEGFQILNDIARAWIDADISNLRNMLLTGRYTSVIYPGSSESTVIDDTPVQTLGSGVFKVNIAVKEYITQEIYATVDYVNNRCQLCYPIPDPTVLGEFQDSENTIIEFFNCRENMLQVGWDVFSEKTAADIVGFVIAGNAGLVGGSLQTNDPGDGVVSFNIDTRNKSQHLPVEEGVLTVIHAATQLSLLTTSLKAAATKWGMRNMSNTADKSTHQLPGGYENAGPDDYRKCIPLHPLGKDNGYMFHFYPQRGVGRIPPNNLQEWNDTKKGNCKVYITAGPQANREHDSPGRNTMGRTFDKFASENLVNFFEKITQAYTAAFEKMDMDECTVAIVPGLSTGLYAPTNMGTYVTTKIPFCIQNAVRRLKLNKIKRIYYCHA
jgi:hypothetical protein